MEEFMNEIKVKKIIYCENYTRDDGYFIKKGLKEGFYEDEKFLWNKERKTLWVENMADPEYKKKKEQAKRLKNNINMDHNARVNLLFFNKKGTPDYIHYKGIFRRRYIEKKILDIGPYQMDEKLYWNQARENLYVENIEDQEYKKEKEQEIVYYKNKEGKLGYYDEGCFYWNKEEGRLFFL